MKNFLGLLTVGIIFAVLIWFAFYQASESMYQRCLVVATDKTLCK